MKHFLLSLSLFFIIGVTQAQQGLPVLVTSTTQGKIYEINVNDCSGRFICTTGKDFNDIAFTPNGKLYGRTIDSLFRIDTITGNTFVIGRAPQGNALVGLNDSILFIDSLHYLLSIKTTNAATKIVGDMTDFAMGDFTWVGKYLYVFASNTIGGLIRITLDSFYQEIIQVNNIATDPNTAYDYATPAIASILNDSADYTIIAFPGNTDYYSLNPETGTYQLRCSGTVVSTSGAASSLFPPLFQQPTSVKEFVMNKTELEVYPNPSSSKLFVEVRRGNDNNFQTTIVDILGKVLFAKKWVNEKIEINIALLKTGNYYLILYDKNKNMLGSYKIVKE